MNSATSQELLLIITVIRCIQKLKILELNLDPSIRLSEIESGMQLLYCHVTVCKLFYKIEKICCENSQIWNIIRVIIRSNYHDQVEEYL